SDKGRDNWWQQRDGGAGVASDVEASHLRRADLFRRLEQSVDPGQRLAGFGVEQETLRGGRQAAVAPLEQQKTQLLLEPRNLRADCGLRHPKGRRGVGDGAVIDDGAEGLEKTNVHESNKVPLLPAASGNARVKRSLEGRFGDQQDQPLS